MNLVAALRSLKFRYGAGFVLSMAPETFFVRVATSSTAAPAPGDNRTGSYLPVIHALTVLHVQDYNSGPVMGLDGRYHMVGGADFHIAMTDMLEAGFPVVDTGQVFPGLREDQIAFGVAAAVSAGNGHTAPAAVQQALSCLTRHQSCGGYALRGGASPALRGADDVVDQPGPLVPERPPAVPGHPALIHQRPAGRDTGRPRRGMARAPGPARYSQRKVRAAMALNTTV
ncbi:hypothetical protein [Actinokineospora sp. PR83]|uniref:hypothetical protein n=1 Tax=Actinokineospora sp. PR83 TaxID=2884908 RepID=UPI0027E0150A|nr:hypothetical protein [Actinokineospora sp. PR83]